MSEGKRLAGVKQTARALEKGRAVRIFLAEDADPRITEPLEKLSAEKGVPVEKVPHMKDLGRSCGISVGSAAAVLVS